MAVTKEKIWDVLKRVKDPGLNRDLVDLGMIKDIE
ncbi:MAG: DUF59 domain-containing protein, partial [Deltaproteobacteria bacterium]|nr:DUF59 domain-containing protein [Deltaproteobacteria bacterium]